MVLFPHLIREYRRAARKLLRRPQQDPWMRYREIALVEDVLRTLKPKRCLEWGTGSGTLAFTRLLPPGARWTSIEHDRAWCERTRAVIDRPGVEIHHVSADREPWSTPDGTYDDFRAYVDFPSESERFDFIFVDGRSRVACLEKARRIVEEDGIVILHDANRRQYHEPFGRYGSHMLFEDYRTYGGGVWIGSPRSDLRGRFDLHRHIAVWERASGLAQRLLETPLALVDM